MSKKYALLVGLTEVSPSLGLADNGRPGCWGCELDVLNVGAALGRMGYADAQIVHLVDDLATLDSWRIEMEALAICADPGDVVTIWHSGHGTQGPDDNGDEPDALDEFLVLYDGLLRDDEYWAKLRAFRRGVTIYIGTDACHSGTSVRVPLGTLATRNLPQMDATVVHMSGCRDDGVSLGYRKGGVFTEAVCRAIMDNTHKRGANAFMVDVEETVSRTSSQRPELSVYGPSLEDRERARKAHVFIGPAPVAVETPTLEVPVAPHQDTARLDWLYEHDAFVFPPLDGDGAWAVMCVSGTGRSSSLRSAIDAAMGAGEGV